MKRIETIFFASVISAAIVLLCAMSLGKKGDTWWYVHGAPDYWHYQPDVFAFRALDADKWQKPLNNGCVKYLFHRKMHFDKMNIIYFKPECSESEINVIKDQIRSDELFETEFPVITKNFDLNYASALWFATDDMILVNFNPDSLNQTRFNQFKQDYGLKQINFPDSIFPQGISTYIFQFDPSAAKPNSAIDLSRIIYSKEKGLVANVQPNLINAFEEIKDNEKPLSRNDAVVLDNDLQCYVAQKDNSSVKLFIKGSDLQNIVVKIYDLFGRIMNVFRVENGRNEYDINISDYASGIYFAGLENELGRVLEVRKFVKL